MSDTRPDLTHISHWVFDLDNTLYPSDAPIMSQVDRRMTEFVAQFLDLPHTEAREVQKHYWRTYGTTLNGLMEHHGVDQRAFMEFVHDIDASVIDPDHTLADRIAALPGTRLVYTNGSLRHAENVLGRLGLDHLFDDIFDVEAADFTPKPHREGFDRFTRRFNLPIPQSVFFEDSVRNLKTAHELGFTTVLVRAKEGDRDEESAGPGEHPDHVHYAVDCLSTFLGDIRTKTSKDEPS